VNFGQARAHLIQQRTERLATLGDQFCKALAFARPGFATSSLTVAANSLRTALSSASYRPCWLTPATPGQPQQIQGR